MLSSSIKRHGLVEQIKNQDLTVCCLKETHFNFKDTFAQSEWIEKDMSS